MAVDILKKRSFFLSGEITPLPSQRLARAVEWARTIETFRRTKGDEGDLRASVLDSMERNELFKKLGVTRQEVESVGWDSEEVARPTEAPKI